MPKKEKESQKKDSKKEGSSEKKKAKKSGGCIGNKSPGPARYILPTLTGYPNHDTTKYRNPAYSFRSRQTSQPPCNSPGPKYNVLIPAKILGFTIGMRGTSMGSTCTPGPYKLPDYVPYPRFSIGYRTNPRSGAGTPGPYKLPELMKCKIPDKIASPCFTFGRRPCGIRCDASPGPKFGPMNMNVVKPKAPEFGFGMRQTGTTSSCGPGPKYAFCSYACSKCEPNFSFGIKHSECAPPLITECDEKC